MEHDIALWVYYRGDVKKNEVGMTLSLLNWAAAVLAEEASNDEVKLIVWNFEANKRMQKRAVSMKEDDTWLSEQNDETN